MMRFGAKSAIGLMLLLAGCAQGGTTTATTTPTAPRLATRTESLHTVIPPAMKLGLHQLTDRFEVAEYIPDDQTMTTWTNMFAATMLPRQPGVTLDQLVERQREGAAGDCAMAIAATQPTRFTDDGLPAVAQGISCGRTKAGHGRLTVIKTVLGKSAVFQVQRAYRLPPAATSNGVRLPPGAKDEIATRLQHSFVCSIADPTPRCR